MIRLDKFLAEAGVGTRTEVKKLTGKGLLFMIVISLYYGISSGGVDNWGHIGGLIMGFLMGILLYRKKINSGEKTKYVDFEDENPYTN